MAILLKLIPQLKADTILIHKRLIKNVFMIPIQPDVLFHRSLSVEKRNGSFGTDGQ